MTDEVRLDVKLRVSQTTADTISRLAEERHTTRTGLVMQALGLLHASHDAGKEGYFHGLTKDRSKLDTVLVGPL
jgi:hypothetical protein